MSMLIVNKFAVMIADYSSKPFFSKNHKNNKNLKEIAVFEK